MKLNLTSFHFRELITKGYSLDHIFLLKMIQEQLDLLPLMKDSEKITALVQSLNRKGLITDDGSKLTTTGIDLLVFMDSKEPKKIEKKKEDDSKFMEWWQAFPGTAEFTHKGRSFTSDRGVRLSKDDCRTKFYKIINEGEYTADEIIAATKLHIHKIKEESVRVNDNKMRYLHNSLTYLNQKDFDPFIEKVRNGERIEKEQTFTGTTDI